MQAKDGFLTYDQKYMQWSKGGAVKGAPAKAAPAKGGGVSGHEIPAPLPEGRPTRVRADAMRAFDACRCDGVARVDFLLTGDEVFVNEINTLPGSLAFYLWEASGLRFDRLLETMLAAAVARADARGGRSCTPSTGTCSPRSRPPRARSGRGASGQASRTGQHGDVVLQAAGARLGRMAYRLVRDASRGRDRRPCEEVR